MVNKEQVVIKCSNTRVMNKLKGEFREIEENSNTGELWVRDTEGKALRVLSEVTTEYPGEVITAEHSLEREKYLIRYIYEYSTGVCFSVDVKTNYWIACFIPPEGYPEKDIRDKTVDLFSRIDRVYKIGNRFNADMNEDKEIIIIFPISESYKVKATKRGNVVFIDFIEKVEEWREISTMPF